MYECESCDAKFSLGQDSTGKDVVTAGRCPNCGSSSYRQVPNPVDSPMEMRDMPAPGEEDMGGNPLQEGIMGQIDGGWQNRQKRDESFASVKPIEVLADVGPRTRAYIDAKREMREAWESTQDHNAVNQVFQKWLDHPDITPPLARRLINEYESLRYPDQGSNRLPHYEHVLDTYEELRATDPQQAEAYLQNVQEQFPEVANLVREQVETGGKVNLSPLYETGDPNVQADSITDMQYQVQHNQAPHAPEAAPATSEHSLQWTPGTAGRGVFVGDALHTWPVEKTPENPTGGLMHGEYLKQIGADPSHGASGFEIEPDGTMIASWGSRDPQLAQKAQQIDPNLKDASTGFEDFGDFTLAHRTHLYNDQLMFLADVPVTDNAVAELTEVPPVEGEVEFETTDVIPPGGHSVEVTPMMGPGKPGWHNGNLWPLQQLGVQINGKPVDVRELFGVTGPATITHEDPQVLEVAKQIAEAGSIYPVEGEFNEVLHPHQAQIDAPNGITDDLHMALGAFDAAVEHPETGQLGKYRQHHQAIRAAYPGGPLRIGTDNPQLTQLLADYAQTGDKSGLLAYQQQQPQQRAAANVLDAFGDAVGDVAGGALDAGQSIGLVPENLSLGELAGTASWLIPGGLAARGALAAGRLANGALAAGAGANAARAGGLLNKAKNLGGKYLAFRGAQEVGNNLLGMGQQPQMGPQQPYMMRNIQQLTHLEVLAAGWHPSADPVMHEDQKEVKDGDIDAIWDQLGTEIGGTDSLHGLLDGNEGVDAVFEQFFPKLFLYNLSEESAADDDDPQFVQFVQELAVEDKDGDGEISIEELFDAFEEHLNQLEDALTSAQPDDNPSHEQMKSQWANSEDGKLANVPNLPTTGVNPGHIPVPPNPQAPQVPNTNPNERTCPNCGGPISPEATTCPNCGQGTGEGPAQQGAMQAPPQSTPTMAPLNPQVQAKRHEGAEHMGPHNNEQFAAVAELLQEEGREDEIPGMLAEPWLYAEELARAQAKLNKPPIDNTQTEAPPEPAMEVAPPGATMPVPGMTPPGGAPPGGGMMPMAARANESMMSAVEKYATPDGYAPRCPNCGSGTTGLISEDGDCECHACGNQFKKEIVTDDIKTGGVYLADEKEENPIAVPAADQDQQRDISREEDSSLSWVDEAGNPLHVGEQYEMHIPGVNIPDIIRVKAVKPRAIEVEYEGEYGIKHVSEITRDEADIEELTFVRLDAEAEAGEEAPDPLDANQMDSPVEVGPGDQTDLSSPHIKATKTAGAKYSPSEQRNFIDEPGVARNRDKLNLAGTHYEETVFELEDDDLFANSFLFGL